jgi:hypothetical protein
MEGTLKTMLNSKLKTAMALMLHLAACTCMVRSVVERSGRHRRSQGEPGASGVCGQR